MCDEDFDFSSQSPIPIVLSETTRLRPPVQLCYCHYFSRRDTVVRVENDGFTVKASLPGILKKPVLKCGPLKEQYIFEEVEFRWSDQDDNGSEHSIDGRKYAVECQLVHYNRRFRCLEDAKKVKDGVVVVAVLMESCDFDNYTLDHMLDAIFRVPCRNTHYSYQTRCFFEWLEHADLNEYVKYSGSLTTSPYTENVTWFVVTNPISISLDQLAAFRKLQIYRGELRIETNARELQSPPLGLDIEYTGVLKPRVNKLDDIESLQSETDQKISARFSCV